MPSNHSRLIEVHTAHGEELGQTKTFQEARRIQAQLLSDVNFASILLIGPGHGDEASDIFSFLHRDPATINIVACDLNATRTVRFRERFPTAQIHIGDILSPESREVLERLGPFDVIQMSFVLHDQTEASKPQLLGTIRNLLVDGGCLVTADPTLGRYPNYRPLIPNEEALAYVRAELHNYFWTYIHEIEGWTISESRRVELIESLKKGLVDALEHKDGREAFDTLDLYHQRFESSGFTNVHIAHGFNTVKIVRAIKPAKIAP